MFTRFGGRGRRCRRRGFGWGPNAVFCLGRYSALLKKENGCAYHFGCDLAKPTFTPRFAPPHSVCNLGL